MKCLFKRFFYIFLPGKKRKIKDTKEKLRVKIKVKKQLLSEEDKHVAASEVFSKIENLPAFKQARSILLYWSTPSELPTHEYVRKWSKNKTVLLPSVCSSGIRLKKFIPSDDSFHDKNEILEPKTETYTGSFDLAIIPGIAFDENKLRMGRGRGYYDRFLAHHRATTIGVGFDFQILESIPTLCDDVKVKMVISPNRTIE